MPLACSAKGRCAASRSALLAQQPGRRRCLVSLCRAPQNLLPHCSQSCGSELIYREIDAYMCRSRSFRVVGHQKGRCQTDNSQRRSGSPSARQRLLQRSEGHAPAFATDNIHGRSCEWGCQLARGRAPPWGARADARMMTKKRHKWYRFVQFDSTLSSFLKACALKRAQERVAVQRTGPQRCRRGLTSAFLLFPPAPPPVEQVERSTPPPPRPPESAP